MGKTYRTPGVYIQETNAFPNAVEGVKTAVPAFIGYTESSNNNGQSLLNKPIQINSLQEYEDFFGQGAQATFSLVEVTKPTLTPANYDVKLGNKTYSLLVDHGTRFNLYESMKFFFQNGGGKCYVVSVGTYKDGVISPEFSITPFLDGLEILKKESEPTILVIPDAVLLDDNNCYSLQEQMLNHCGELQNCFAILDIHSGDQDLDDPIFSPIDTFRNQVSSEFLSYGAAYYPWLNTTIVQASEVNFTALNSSSRVILKSICEDFINDSMDSSEKAIVKPFVDQLTAETRTQLEIKKSDNVLRNMIPDYKLVMLEILQKKNVLPPSGAMAGIYCVVDAQRGVWKAPANVRVSSVVSPVIPIDQDQQSDLNNPFGGKAVCAIRTFPGMGIMVWGARTLDANSLDWRYINVRRTMIMIEQSIKLAAKAYVFEPNDKNTWVSVQSIIENFMTSLWNQGALVGAKPSDAFAVRVGLGDTMTVADISEGIMRVQILVAMLHSAEFIVISFEQQMQKS